MKPAFSSSGQAAAFTLLLLLLLLLPALFGKSVLPPREQIYSSIPWRLGAYPYLHHEIFDEKGDIAMVFLGASPIYYGIDTPYVEAALTKDLGRKATVISTAWNFGGFDAFYFIAQDLLEHRKVHTIVFVGAAAGNGPEEAAPYWFRFGDNAEAFAGMPAGAIPRFYFAAILGMPRTLLSLIRPNSPDYLFSPDRLAILGVHSNGENPATRLGSLAVETAWYLSDTGFTEYTPVSHASPSDVCIYSPVTADKFHFQNLPLSPLQIDFVRKFARLAREHGTRLVLLDFPNTDSLSDPFIQMSGFWPNTLQTDVDMVGLPAAKFFSGIASEDVQKLFYNSQHLNKNGQEYFTKLVTPALLKIYETPSGR